MPFDQSEAAAVKPPIACTPPSTWMISPVVAGNQSDSSATQACAAGARRCVMSQPSGARSAHSGSNSLEARDALGGHGAQRPGGHQVDPDPLPAQIAGQVAGAGLQAGLGHAHPVVAGPGHAGVEVEADDRPAAVHQRQRGHGQRLERVGGHLQRGRHVLPPGGQEVAAQRALRRVADRVHHAVQARRRARGPARPASRAARCRSRPAPAPAAGRAAAWRSARPGSAGRSRSGRRVAPCFLRDPRHVEGDRGVGEHAGDQDPLAVEYAHRRVLLRQWPMPRPPSTGMTAPVM